VIPCQVWSNTVCVQWCAWRDNEPASGMPTVWRIARTWRAVLWYLTAVRFYGTSWKVIPLTTLVTKVPL